MFYQLLQTEIIYIDGIEVARSINAHSGSALGTGTNRFGFIGDGSEAPTFNGSRNNLYYNGSINEVRIWNTTRTAAQILNNKDLPLSGSEPNLNAYYNFNEASGTVLNDISGNGNTGTLFNFNTLTAWTTGNSLSIPSCESPRTIATANIIGTGLTDQKLSCGSTSLTLDAGAGFSSQFSRISFINPLLIVHKIFITFNSRGVNSFFMIYRF